MIQKSTSPLEISSPLKIPSDDNLLIVIIVLVITHVAELSEDLAFGRWQMEFRPGVSLSAMPQLG